jgi:hypothetical protein
MAADCEQSMDIIKWGISIGVPIVSALAGVFIGSWLSSKQSKQARKHSFIEKQLGRFYSPILGLRSEIEMRNELRLKIQNAANSCWKELCEDTRSKGGSEALQQLSEKRFSEFKNIIDYDNRILAEQLIPAYKQMLTIFRENMWLAEPETVEYFKELLEFIDIWDRWLDRSMPVEVWEKLNHTEKKLKPLYKNLEETHTRLREKLESGEV